MKHAEEYLETMEKLVPLIRQGRRYRNWRFDQLCDWTAYFWNRGTIGWVIDDWGEAKGVCIIKFFRRLEQFLEPFVHEPDGQFCMIELLVADGPEMHGWLLDDLIRRWGWPEIMMWDRGDRTMGGAPRMYTQAQFMKLAYRFTKIKQQEVKYGRRR